MSTFHLEIVTPDKKFYSNEVEMAVVRTTEGDIGILRDHEPTVAPVSIGKIRIKENGVFRDAACAGGFMTIEEEKTTVVTDSAEWSDEIDVDRATGSYERAKERLSKEGDNTDMYRARVALARATNRIRVSDKEINHADFNL